MNYLTWQRTTTDSILCTPRERRRHGTQDEDYPLFIAINQQPPEYIVECWLILALRSGIHLIQDGGPTLKERTGRLPPSEVG